MRRNPRIIKEKRNKKVSMYSEQKWKLFDTRDIHLKCDDTKITGFTRDKIVDVNSDSIVLHLSIMSPFLLEDLSRFDKFELEYKSILISMKISDWYIEPNIKIDSSIPTLKLHLMGIPKVEVVCNEK